MHCPDPTTDTDEPAVDITINDDRDGSEEKPYIIYSADAFKAFVVDKYVDENGKYIDYTKVGEDGELVYPLLNAGLHYELDRDIDFAGTELTTLFNKGVAFNGHIDGKGFALKNITIAVTAENIAAMMNEQVSALGVKSFDVNVAIFGNVDGATFKNVKFDAVSITVADDVLGLDYINEFNKTFGGSLNQITVAPIATFANNSTFEDVVVNSTVDAGVYARYAKTETGDSSKVQGANATSGFVAIAEGCTINKLTVKTDLTVDQGKNFFVGGAFGYVYDSSVKLANVEVSVKSNYKQALYIGGFAGYALGLDLDESIIALNATEASEERFAPQGAGTVYADSDYTWVAGIVNVIRANDETQKTTINNVSVKSNVDIDAIFAGAVIEVRNADYGSGDANGDGVNEGAEAIVGKEKLVTFTDVVIDSEVNTLKAYGFARRLVLTSVTLKSSECGVDAAGNEYNLRLVGNIKLSYVNANGEYKMKVAHVFALESYESNLEGGISTIKGVVSASILGKVVSIAQFNKYCVVV